MFKQSFSNKDFFYEKFVKEGGLQQKTEYLENDDSHLDNTYSSFGAKVNIF